MGIFDLLKLGIFFFFLTSQAFETSLNQVKCHFDLFQVNLNDSLFDLYFY